MVGLLWDRFYNSDAGGARRKGFSFSRLLVKRYDKVRYEAPTAMGLIEMKN